MQLRILQSPNIFKFKSKQDGDFEWRLWMRSSSTQQGHFKFKFQIDSKCMQSFHCILCHKHFLRFDSFYTILLNILSTWCTITWSMYFLIFRNSCIWPRNDLFESYIVWLAVEIEFCWAIIDRLEGLG